MQSRRPATARQLENCVSRRDRRQLEKDRVDITPPSISMKSGDTP
jgi:hypothetical protein